MFSLETLKDISELIEEYSFGLVYEEPMLIVEMSPRCNDLDESKCKLESSYTKPILSGSWKLISRLLTDSE